MKNVYLYELPFLFQNCMNDSFYYTVTEEIKIIAIKPFTKVAIIKHTR